MSRDEVSQRLTAFFEREQKSLTDYVRRLVRSPEVAEEIVQDMMVRLLRLEDLSSIRNLNHYAYFSVKNLVTDYRLRQANGEKALKRFGEYMKVDEDAVEFSFEQDYEGQRLVGQLDAILLTLPDKERMAFVKKAEGFTQREIAEMTGWSVGKVNAVLQKVLEMTKHLFS